MALAMSGCACPCKLTHQLDIISLIRRPSSSSRYNPLPDFTVNGSGLTPLMVKGFQMLDDGLMGYPQFCL